MMVMGNSKERTCHQWQTLVSGADPRWEMESMTIQEGSIDGLL